MKSGKESLKNAQKLKKIKTKFYKNPTERERESERKKKQASFPISQEIFDAMR